MHWGKYSISSPSAAVLFGKGLNDTANALSNYWKCVEMYIMIIIINHLFTFGLAWSRGLMHQLWLIGYISGINKLRSVFESRRGQLVVSRFQDPISYGRFTGATDIICALLGLGANELNAFSIFSSEIGLKTEGSVSMHKQHCTHIKSHLC